MKSPEQKKLEQKQRSRVWYLRNKRLAKDRARIWKGANPDKVLESGRLYRSKNKNKFNGWRKAWRAKNYERERVMNLMRLSIRNKVRRKTDPIFKVKELLRGRLNKSLSRFKGGKLPKCKSTEKMLGCSFSDFVKHIESQFTDGMTWQNHGPRGWHIDHIKQICEFDLSDLGQQKACFHHKNMQPLWWYHNLAKRFSKYEQTTQVDPPHVS